MAISIKEREKKVKSEFLTRLGNHIRKLRTKKDISGAELARLLFMERSNISRLEMGRVNISVYLIKQICDVLEINLKEFWKEF